MNALQRINRRHLLTPKLLYFSINMQHYILHKFRSQFVQSMFGVRKSDVGRGLGMLLFVAFFMNIFVAAMNDKFGRPKAFIVGLLSASCAFFQLFYVEKYIRIFPFMFWVNFFAYLATNTPIPALLDKVVLDYLGSMQIGTKVYGEQRIWGTVGYSLSTFLAEALLRTKEGTTRYDFSNLRYYSLASTLVAMAFAGLLISESGSKGKAQRQDIWSGCRELLRNTDYLFFIFIIFLNGLTRAGMTIYLSTYMREILNIHPYILPAWWHPWARGAVWIFNSFPFSTISVFESVLEITLLFYSQAITRRMGLYWPLLIAQAAQLVRFVLYIVLPHTNNHVFAFCCMFELLKGINFGLTHSSGVQLAAELCPPHLKTTSQMIYTGTFTAMGSVAAGLVFGNAFGDEERATHASMEQRVQSFRVFFSYNIAISAMTIILFVCKYGIRDRILFGKAAR